MAGQDERVGAPAISAVLRDLAAPVFAAAWSKRRHGEELFVHVAAAPNRSALKRQLANALSSLGLENVHIRFHNAAQLHAPRSLEQLVENFPGGAVVYDPTGTVCRAKALVAAGHAVRAALADMLFGIYYAPRRRTFYVALKATSVAIGHQVKVGDLASIERAVGAAIRSVFAPALDECPAVGVGFGLPDTNLVAIDRQSVVSWGAT